MGPHRAADEVEAHPVHGHSAPGLSTNRILSVQKGPDGAIWLGLETGALARRDPLTGDVRSWTLSPGEHAPPVWIARDGTVWTATLHGLARFDGRDFAEVPLDEGIRPLTITEAPDAALWMAGEGDRVVRYDGVHTPVFRPEDGVRHGIRAVAVGPDGGVWAAAWQGMFRVSGDRLLPLEGAPGASAFRAVWPIGPDDAWADADTGLVRWTAGRLTVVDPVDPSVPPRRTEVATDTGGHTWALGNGGVFRDGVRVATAARGEP